MNAQAQATHLQPTWTAPSNLLARMNDNDLATLKALGSQHAYSRGEHVFNTGSPGEHVYFLEHGRVKIYQLSPAGKEVILWFCFSGEMFGLGEMAYGGGRVVAAQACEEARILRISVNSFNSFMETHPKSALLVMQLLACRLRVLGEILVNVASDDVNTRIAKLILRLGALYGTRHGEEIHIDIHLTHQEMADMVGATRQTVTSVLSHMKRQGFLSIDNRCIHVESAASLGQMTTGGNAPHYHQVQPSR